MKKNLMMKQLQLNTKKTFSKQQNKSVLPTEVDFCFLGEGSYDVSSSSSFSDVKPVSDPRIVNIGSEPKSSIRFLNADGKEVTSAMS
jgi:hypothetical protein